MTDPNPANIPSDQVCHWCDGHGRCRECRDAGARIEREEAK